jgi:hypothetical protein
LDWAMLFASLGGLIFLSLWLQAGSVHRAQDALLAHTNMVGDTKKQLMANLPEITGSTRLFANRFLLTAPYFTPTAAVWYGRPELSGGTLESLKEYEEVTPNFYLFDYEDGSLYNLLPELQEHRRTMLLWRQPPVSMYRLYENGDKELIDPKIVELDIVTGPPHDRRLGIQVPSKAQAWTSIVYEIWVPPNGRLAAAILPQENQRYRIIANDPEGNQTVIYEWAGEQNSGSEWIGIEVPLYGFAGEFLKLSFDFRGSQGNQDPGYWSNPRIVVD